MAGVPPQGAGGGWWILLGSQHSTYSTDEVIARTFRLAFPSRDHDTPGSYGVSGQILTLRCALPLPIGTGALAEWHRCSRRAVQVLSPSYVSCVIEKVGEVQVS